MDAINPPVSLRLTPPLRRGARESIDYVSFPITNGGERGDILRLTFPLQSGSRGEIPTTSAPPYQGAGIEYIDCDRPPLQEEIESFYLFYHYRNIFMYT